RHCHLAVADRALSHPGGDGLGLAWDRYPLGCLQRCVGSASQGEARGAGRLRARKRRGLTAGTTSRAWRASAEGADLAVSPSSRNHAAFRLQVTGILKVPVSSAGRTAARECRPPAPAAPRTRLPEQFATADVCRPFKQILRTIDYVARHCSADHPDPAAYRRDPDLAVQLRLGLLSLRRRRPHPDRRVDSRPPGTNLAA